MKVLTTLAAAFFLAFPVANAGAAEPLKALASIQGVRQNQLIGYGLVVGLDGSGDQTTQTPFTVQSVASMLQQMGVSLPPGINLQLKNVAAVMVTASMPAFAQPGQSVDITVSSMGNAKSLRGGTLLLTPLKGADGKVYAMAQGNLVVAQAGAGGGRGQPTHLSVGRIANGATVERSAPNGLVDDGTINVELNETSFSTARRVADAINAKFGSATALAQDGRVIRVRTPIGIDSRVGFLGDLEDLMIEPSQSAPKVILNARTGSVVMNQAVTLEPCAVAHGSLSVVVTNDLAVTQPSADGRSVTTQTIQVSQQQGGGNIIALRGGASLSDVVKALNSIGATPQDLLAILQAMKSSGSLRAELEVI